MSEQENQPTLIDSLQLSEYVDLLKKHDWYFAYSDDRRCFDKGQRERNVLIARQQKLDPDFGIWNHHAPRQFRKDQ